MYYVYVYLWYFKVLNLRYGTESTLIIYLDRDTSYNEYIPNLCNVEHYSTLIMTRSV